MLSSLRVSCYKEGIFDLTWNLDIIEAKHGMVELTAIYLPAIPGVIR